VKRIYGILRGLGITYSRLTLCNGASVPVSLMRKSWYMIGTSSFVSWTSSFVSITKGMAPGMKYQTRLLLVWFSPIPKLSYLYI
jgi:hypothetical protein